MIITPFGAAVDPDVYCRNASVSPSRSGAFQRSASPSSTESVASCDSPARSGTPATHRSASASKSAGGQDGRGTRVGHDRLQSGHGTIGPGQVRGDGDDARVEAAEEGGDEVEPRRIEQEGPFAYQAAGLEPRRDGAARGPAPRRSGSCSDAGSPSARKVKATAPAMCALRRRMLDDRLGDPRRGPGRALMSLRRARPSSSSG